jgi:hypothetical protein
MDTGKRRYTETHRRNVHANIDQMKMQHSVTKKVTSKGRGKK